MIHFFTGAAAILLLILTLGLWRIVKGPTAADRMLAAQLFGTAGVALLMILAAAQSNTGLLSAALVLALLSPLTVIAFVKLSGDQHDFD